MKPRFDLLYANYPRTSIKHDDLFTMLGWASLMKDPNYHNTCAIRMALACIRSGVRFSKGGLIIQAGDYKGQRLEPSQGKLSQLLAQMWGEPEKFDDQTLVEKRIGKRKGVISFFGISPDEPRQGHIDLVEPIGDFHACIMSMGCYFSSHKTWFWELP